MSVGEVWCGWFYTLVCNYKFHALTVYLHSTFTAPDNWRCIWNPVKHLAWRFLAEIVTVLRPLAIFAEELHRLSLTRSLTGF